jgi:dUTP pyrophosphatase
VSFKLYIQADHPDYVPKKQHENDAAYDLYAAESLFLAPERRATIRLGIRTAFDGSKYVAILYGRSGLASKNGVDVLGGVIDGGYRGEWMVVLHNGGFDPIKINRGDRICQVVFHEKLNPDIEAVGDIVTAGTLFDDGRGMGGIGSTGV